VERTSEYAENLAAKEGRSLAPVGERLNRVEGERMNAEVFTVGWTDCGHDTWRRGIVLDPFAGSGTTLAVAAGHGRDAIGIDIDERNADLARQRVGMFLDVEHFTKNGAVA
jgi:16S rRNA G966 N2-methylase RsmD